MDLNYNNKLKSFKVDFILLGIMFLAAIMRFYNLGFQSPWLDELSTIQMSDPNLATARTHELIMTREGFPDLYFFLLKYLSLVFGHTIYTLRFFSAFFGTLSIYVIYLLAQELFSKKTGYIAAILLALNFFHINHSQEARTYAFLVFFVILANYRLIKFIKKADLRNALFLGITTGLISNAHPIGLLNIMAIGLFLMVFIIMEPRKDEKLKLLKFSSIIGFIVFIVFLPVYPLIAHVAKIKVFWIPEPSFETIKQAFFELLGSSDVNLYFYLIGFVVFCLVLIFNKKIENKIANKYILSIVVIWFSVNIGVILAKSYLDVSIILNRYFIGVLPLFIIALSYLIGSIKNKIIGYGVLFIFIAFSLHFVIFKKSFYNTVVKSQWNIVADEIIKNNRQRDKILGAYGYVANALYLKSNSEGLGWEITLEDYIKSIKNNTLEKKSFWYIDGNFRPYSLSKENEDYLNQYFTLDYQVDKYDCWAKHYTLKGTTSNIGNSKSTDKIYLTDFDSKNYDNLGNLFIFENQTILTKPLTIEKGTYELILNANSLPEIPIDNKNAHIIFKHNNQIIGNCFLSEKASNKSNKFKFVNKDLSSVFSVTFDNDFSKNSTDRNVIIYSIELNKL